MAHLPELKIRFHSLGSYRGAPLFAVATSMKVTVFIVQLDKFYSSVTLDPLYAVVDEWWRVRMNCKCAPSGGSLPDGA